MKVDIIFGILLTLLNKDKVTASYLANKFEISVRSVYRYLSILDTNNIPLSTKSGKGGGIYLINKISMQNLFFNNLEKETLLELSQNISDPKLKISIQTKLFALH